MIDRQYTNNRYYFSLCLLMICMLLIIAPGNRLISQEGDIRVHDPVLIRQDSVRRFIP